VALRELPKELPTPPSVKGRATMRALLDAAREVLVRDGYVGARVSDISAAAGLSNGAFYRYFTDKQQIMLHVIREFLAVSREVVHVPFDPAKPMASVRASTERYFEYYLENAPVWRAVIEAGQMDPHVETIRLREIDDWCARITHMLERGVKLGVVRGDIDCTIAGYLLGGMAQAYAQHAYRPGSGLEQDPATLAAEVTKLWESGAFLPAAGASSPS
jgi:AcrR family transcriptional regulator